MEIERAYVIDNSPIEAGDVVMALTPKKGFISKGDIVLMDTRWTFIDHNGIRRFRFFIKFRKLKATNIIAPFPVGTKLIYIKDSSISASVKKGKLCTGNRLISRDRVHITYPGDDYYRRSDFLMLHKAPVVSLTEIYTGYDDA